MDTLALITAGESLGVEFKSDINDTDLTRAVACLANGQGGVLLLGVQDDGTVVGARPRHGNVIDPHRVAALIQNTTEPPLAVAVALDVVDDHQVVRIDVPRADPGPVGTRDGVFTKRVIDTTGRPQCLPMTAHEIVSMGMVTRGQDYAAAVANVPALSSGAARASTTCSNNSYVRGATCPTIPAARPIPSFSPSLSVSRTSTS